jgi:hypothetical protein
MKTCVTAVLLALLTFSAVGQQKKLQHLAISTYMSEVGLLYIEEAQNYYDACRHAGGYEAAEARWDKIFDGLDNRITIRLRSSSHPAGDAQFFKLLQVVRLEENMMLRLEELNDPSRKEEQRKHSEGYVICKGAAMADIKSGVTNSQMGFPDLICMDNPAGIH